MLKQSNSNCLRDVISVQAEEKGRKVVKRRKNDIGENETKKEKKNKTKHEAT